MPQRSLAAGPAAEPDEAGLAAVAVAAAAAAPANHWQASACCLQPPCGDDAKVSFVMRTSAPRSVLTSSKAGELQCQPISVPHVQEHTTSAIRF